MAPKYKRGSIEYEEWINASRIANSQGTPQTAEGYEDWIYQRFRIHVGDKRARQLAQIKREEWDKYEKKE